MFDSRIVYTHSSTGIVDTLCGSTAANAEENTITPVKGVVHYTRAHTPVRIKCRIVIKLDQHLCDGRVFRFES
jgi:hypothetical protein